MQATMWNMEKPLLPNCYVNYTSFSTKILEINELDENY